MPHRVLAHTADTGIEANAPTLAELIDELAAGMFGLMADVGVNAAVQWTQTTVSSESIVDLVVDVLSELLWIAEVEDLSFCSFESSVDGHSATISAGALPLDRAVVTGPPIKAVTYHGLRVEESDDGWYGRVYFDV